MTDPAFRLVPVEEYLRLERDNPTRHDYIDGFVYAQAGPLSRSGGQLGGGNDDYTETEPCLIVEMLSESTRMADQNYKAERYRELPSLQAYLLVDSRSAAIWRRT